MQEHLPCHTPLTAFPERWETPRSSAHGTPLAPWRIIVGRICAARNEDPMEYSQYIPTILITAGVVLGLLVLGVTALSSRRQSRAG